MSASHHQSLAPASRVEDLASISVVRYLDATGLASAKVAGRGLRWKWLAGAVFFGALFGIGLNFYFDVEEAAVLQHLARVSLDGPAQTVVSVPFNDEALRRPVAARMRPASSELEEIRTRNRRLEALVKVLRHRDTDKRHTVLTSPPG